MDVLNRVSVGKATKDTAVVFSDEVLARAREIPLVASCHQKTHSETRLFLAFAGQAACPPPHFLPPPPFRFSQPLADNGAAGPMVTISFQLKKDIET